MPVSVRDNVLQIKVNYSPSVIEKIKTITGRRYNPSDHSWSVPVEFLAQLREALPDLHYDASCEEALERISRVVNASSAMESSLVAVELPGGTLRPYQAAGVRYIEGHGGRAMLADEMGLGKTIQTLGYIARHPDFTVVVVCPSAVKVQWKREAEKWLDCGKGVVEIAEGRSPRTPALACGILIINYDVLPYWQDKLIEWDADLLVLDESVYVKERKSKRSIAAVALAKQARHVLALSGRPVLNKPYELWNQLAIVRPDLPFGSWTAFNTRYSGYHKDHWGWQMGAAANLEELEFRLRANVMIQRKKIEVLTELPDLDRVTVALEVEPPETLDISTIEDITAARKEAGLLKLLPAIQWLQEAKENLGQIVVFAHHHDVTGTLAAALEAPPPIDGRMPQKERQKWVDRFQAGLEPILVCGTRAMGMGVNMQAGSTCVFVELDWTMAAHEQAESRLHRMGQKNAVTAYYLVAEGTIDEPIMQMLSDKQTITEKVVGEEPTVRVLDRLKEIIEKRGA